MPIEFQDPTDDILRRKREIEQRIADIENNPGQAMDSQELREREEAAKAYAGENEKHFVDYLMDCVKQSVEGSKEIRQTQARCYDAYKENEPVHYAKKDAWQSRIVVPKPYETVQYGAAAVKKAFTPKFLSISNVKVAAVGEFWKKIMEFQLNEQHAKFVTRFTDAVTMGLAIGTSLEMLPRWVPGLGLEYVLIEPWKIHRDPDANSRDCQSGLFWVHQEWLDYFVLKEGEKNGRYFKVARVKDTDNDPNNEFMTKEAVAARKGMIWKRSEFRTMILTSEFWGMVLDPKGNLLLDKATYTVAGGRVIQYPEAVNYARLRWPGIAFSPLPDLLKMGGRGLLESILTIWEAMNNLMCLHVDNLQWVVNPMTEINVDALVDPEDAEGYPGKEYLVRDTVSGQQAIRSVNRRGATSDVLGNMQYLDQCFQRGSFVPDAVQGLPGYRKDMTYRESAMLLDQALGVYSLMGENVEQGAIEAIMAGAELVLQHATYADYLEIFSEEELNAIGIRPDENSPNGVTGVPDIDGSFHVSGIQALMKDNECLLNLKEVFLPLAESPVFGPYIKPYNILKSIEIRTNLTDEDVILSTKEYEDLQNKQKLAQQQEEEAIEQAAADEQAAMAEQQAAGAEQQDLQAAHGMADLVGKIQNIDGAGKESAPAKPGGDATAKAEG